MEEGIMVFTKRRDYMVMQGTRTWEGASLALL
jgi:hypothetical protein